MIPLYLIFLLLSTSMTQAVIVSVDHVKNTKMPEFQAKRFILYGDHHGRSEEDVSQLEALTQALLTRDQESSQKMHIFIEKPAGMLFYDSVLGSLIERLEKGYQNTTIQNIEMRCATGAAWRILHPEENPSSISQCTFCDSAYATCVVGNLTFEEVDEEIAMYTRDIDDWIATLDPLHAHAINFWKPELQGRMKQYAAACSRSPAEIPITARTNVMELSTKLYEKAPRVRAVLCHAIEGISAILFDMHICKCIMSSKGKDIIALVAGAGHTSRIYDFLDRIGYQTIARYGSPYSPFRPIAKKYLDPEYVSCPITVPCNVQ